jgi:hypothetical protein
LKFSKILYVRRYAEVVFLLCVGIGTPKTLIFVGKSCTLYAPHYSSETYVPIPSEKRKRHGILKLLEIASHTFVSNTINYLPIPLKKKKKIHVL